MGKLLLACSIVILFILLQTEEIVSISKKGSSRPRIRRRLMPRLFRRPFHNPIKISYIPSYKPSYPSFKSAEIARPPRPPERHLPPNWVENLFRHKNPSIQVNLPPRKPADIYSGVKSLKPKWSKWEDVADMIIEALDSLLEQVMSNPHFNNPNEEQWWSKNHHRYSGHIYYPKYKQPVPQFIFVRDCVNITVKEYIKPTGNTTEDEMEATVVKHVVKKMCTKKYRTFSRSSEGGSSRPHDGNPADSKPKGDEVKYVVGKPVVDAPVKDPESYILGSPIAKMHFRFNDSEEERWWNEHRHRFATHVYHPNFSQPISRDVFLSKCVNVTVAEYVKPTGNQTEDDLEARVVTQVANEKCVEMYPRLTVLTMAGSYYNNKPETATKLEIKSEFRYGEGAAWAKSPRGASGHNPQKNAVSDLHFSFENALFLIHPFTISVITLITPFLIF